MRNLIKRDEEKFIIREWSMILLMGLLMIFTGAGSIVIMFWQSDPLWYKVIAGLFVLLGLLPTIRYFIWRVVLYKDYLIYRNSFGKSRKLSPTDIGKVLFRFGDSGKRVFGIIFYKPNGKRIFGVDVSRLKSVKNRDALWVWVMENSIKYETMLGYIKPK